MSKKDNRLLLKSGCFAKKKHGFLLLEVQMAIFLFILILLPLTLVPGIIVENHKKEQLREEQLQMWPLVYGSILEEIITHNTFDDKEHLITLVWNQKEHHFRYQCRLEEKILSITILNLGTPKRPFVVKTSVQKNSI